MQADFKDKIVLVTGSGRGIGRAIALHFAARGADVVINFFRNRGPAEATAERARTFGNRVKVVKADVGDIQETARLFGEVASELGGLDILVHSAASGYNRPAMQQKPKGWDWTMNINARALLFAAQHAVPLMERRGAGWIVSLTSNGSQRVIPNYVAVGASKAALEALTRYLAVELIAKNIHVNAVSPGVVATDALTHLSASGGPAEIVDRYVKLVPAQELVTPEDVAGVVAFLCSASARMIVGQTIQVDGGYCLTIPS
jgi:enoyl-[acyl-carrier protein] reductase III